MKVEAAVTVLQGVRVAVVFPPPDGVTLGIVNGDLTRTYVT